MPAGNRLGPEGEGPMTGRRMGYCTGYAQPGFHSASFRNSAMIMVGRGRRCRNYPLERRSFFRYPHESGYSFATDEFEPQPITADEEEHVLTQQASWLKNQLDLINTRLEKLQAKKTAEE
jgi:hypothetical protein